MGLVKSFSCFTLFFLSIFACGKNSSVLSGLRRSPRQTVAVDVRKYDYQRTDGPLLFKITASGNSMVRTELCGYSVLGYASKSEEPLVFVDYLAKYGEKNLVLLPKRNSSQYIRVLDQNSQVVFERQNVGNIKGKTNPCQGSLIFD